MKQKCLYIIKFFILKYQLSFIQKKTFNYHCFHFIIIKSWNSKDPLSQNLENNSAKNDLKAKLFNLNFQVKIYLYK